MSSTNRGAVRNELDFYATPEPAFRPMLEPIRAICGATVPVWEPACGDGRLIDLMRGAGMLAFGDDIQNQDTHYDFLKSEADHDCIVTNPPFSLALEFCEHAIAYAPHVFMLLRLNFLASKKRRPFFLAHEPSALFVLSERPSFTANGKTDSIDYAWFYWGAAHKGIFHP